MDRGSPAEAGVDVIPVDHALDQLVTGLDHLIKVVEDGGLDHYDDLALMGFAQEFERFRNRLPLVDHRIVADCESRRVAECWTQPNLSRVLVLALRISSAEAHRRVRAAEAVGRRVSVTGEQLEPRRPVLAEAQRAGAVTPEQVQVIQRALDGVDRPGFDPADVAAGERLLSEQAAVFEPKTLAQLADQVVSAIDPGGSLPDDRLNSDRRHLGLRCVRGGAYVGEFRLTGALGAKLSAVLGPLAKPRVDTTADPDARASRGWSVSTSGRMGSGCMTPSRTCATGCSAPMRCRTAAEPRQR